MPLRKIQSRRTGCRPFFFFKGTIDEIRKALPTEFAKALETAGAKIPEGKASETKKRLLRQLKERATIGWIGTEKGGIPLRIKRLKKGRVCLYQCPAQHGVMPKGGRDSFENLKRILKEGFRAITGDVNVFVTEKRGSGTVSFSKGKQTHGDWYSIELMAPLDYFPHVKSATPQQILSVHVKLNKELTEEQKSGRKRFYRKEITEAFGVPVHFHVSPI